MLTLFLSLACSWTNWGTVLVLSALYFVLQFQVLLKHLISCCCGPHTKQTAVTFDTSPAACDPWTASNETEHKDKQTQKWTAASFAVIFVFKRFFLWVHLSCKSEEENPTRFMFLNLRYGRSVQVASQKLICCIGTDIKTTETISHRETGWQKSKGERDTDTERKEVRERRCFLSPQLKPLWQGKQSSAEMHQYKSFKKQHLDDLRLIFSPCLHLVVLWFSQDH